CIQQLLPCRCTCICRTMVLCPTESSKVKQTFWCTVKHYSHTIQQVYNPRCCFTHRFNRWLVREKVPTVNGIIKMDPRRIPFTLCIYCSIDSTLGAHCVRAFNRNNRKQINIYTSFCSFNCCHQSSKTATNNSYFTFTHSIKTHSFIVKTTL